MSYKADHVLWFWCGKARLSVIPLSSFEVDGSKEIHTLKNDLHIFTRDLWEKPSSIIVKTPFQLSRDDLAMYWRDQVNLLVYRLVFQGYYALSKWELTIVDQIIEN